MKINLFELNSLKKNIIFRYIYILLCYGYIKKQTNSKSGGKHFGFFLGGGGVI